ncbi:acyl-CoA N-acyltransferase [Lyophyllum atratum]|nr:acyl-CoA N-acyltransferase [Lyophyllum atratum]
MHSSALVRRANKASSTQLHQALASLDTPHTLRTRLSNDLCETEKNAIWTLFEHNMRELYVQSSFGWDPPSKRAELFNSLSRFVLIDVDSQLVAFSMFRFDIEEDEDIIYCYDLQIHQDQQRTGLGGLLMQALGAVGIAWRMEKIVLTVFKANLGAIKFYEASGFSVDESSPGYSEDGDDPEDLEDVDYTILSKRLVLP